jgi:hypothetical protein
MALHRLVYRIIDHLEDQMMKPVYARCPYVHTGPLANRLKTFQYLNVLC